MPVFYDKLKDELTFPMSYLNSKESFSNWQKKAKNKVIELAMIKDDNTKYNPVVIDEIDNGKYISKKVVFNITSQSRVLSYLLVPKGKGPFPAVIALHDHGANFDIGKEKVIKPWGDKSKQSCAEKWSQKYFSGQFIGNELANRGYVVLSVDAIGWGDRKGMTYDNQQAFASNLFNIGYSYSGLIASEDIRAANFLYSLDIVDKKNVISFGFSMGAFRSWQLSALSDDITASVSICFMTTTKGVMVEGNNILEGASSYAMLHPGLANYLDIPDVASIAAPKPSLFFSGEKDHLFTLDSINKAYDKMKKIWKKQGSTNKLTTKIWPTGHICTKEIQDEVYLWLDKER
ncbi:MAG: alpha/beta hydrolase family protein [Clostridiales bacterium]